MRKYTKKSIMTCIEDCISCMELLKDTIPDFDSLCDFQDRIIRLGNRIEQEEVDNHVVHMLEDVCEKIYLLTQEEDRDRMQLLYDSISQSLAYVKGYMRDVEEEPYRIAFFPYKAAMWDSLESIYLAARMDEDCECFVIPIPYFDKDPSGSFSEMHYEKALFPKDIELTDWESLDYDAGMFDVAYIHNPYDKYNKVTSVHPQFYSDKLKKFVHRLVYVPYFYTVGRLSSGHTFYPSYNNVDAIIVQNESSKCQIDKMLATEKTYALGSPKLDRLIQADKKCVVPPEWADRIRDKKVVFVNASLSAVLNHKERVLDKLECLFSVAKSFDNLILLWRPHPLMEATIKAMETELYDRYMNIKDRFIEEEMGIFDDGKDLETVVALCHAYIGEQTSSIVGLFAALGKPIMFVDYNLDMTNQHAMPAFFFDLYEEDDDIYFVNGQYPVLCRADKTKGQIVSMEPLNSSFSDSVRAFSECMYVDGRLYFAPFHADKVLSCHLKSHDVQQLEFDNPESQNFNRILLHDKKLYFIPLLAQYLMCVDTETNEITYFYEPLEILKKFSHVEGYICMFAACMVDTKIYIASPTSNCVAEFDVESGYTHCYRIGSENNTYWDMIYDGESFWLNPHTSMAIVRWKKEEGTAEELYRYPSGFKSVKPQEKGMLFLRLVDCDAYILAFPKNANMIVKIDKQSGRMTQYDIDQAYREGDRKSAFYSWPSNYYFAKRCGDKVYAMTAFDNTLIEINLTNGNIRNTRYIFDEYRRGKLTDIIGTEFMEHVSNSFLSESVCYTACDYFRDVSLGKLEENKQKQKYFLRNINNSDGTSGAKIHNKMLELV